MIESQAPEDLIVLRYGESVLQRADLKGVVPTPLDEIAGVLGVHAIVGADQLPRPLTHIRRNGRLKRVLGAFMFRQRVAIVDEERSLGPYRWIKAHELGHAALPWHEQDHRLDSADRLSRDTVEEEERQANLVGAHLLFQGQVFFDHALSYKTSIDVPVYLSERFAVSRHAAIRYYVENHPDPLVLVVASKYVQNGYRRIRYAVASRSFSDRYRDPRQFLPRLGVPERSGLAPAALVEAVRSTRTTYMPHACKYPAEGMTVAAEAYYTGHDMFITLKPTKLIKLGRRLSVEPINAEVSSNSSPLNVTRHSS